MNYIMMAIAIVALVASAVAQTPKETPEKPNLSVSFAKTALRALLAIGDFKGTGGLTGPAKNAYEDARVKADSTSAPETLMIANLLDFAIMRSTDNLARENIILRATAKLDHDRVSQMPPSCSKRRRKIRSCRPRSIRSINASRNA